MAEFFIDPYKKYYDTLQTMTDITGESTAMASAAGTAASSIDGVSSEIGSSDWKEQGVTILSSAALSSLKSNISTLESNITNSLTAACEIAIGSMLPELDSLKTEDENYESIKTKLNELVIPTQYDDEGNTTSTYRMYLSEKNSLEYQLSESERKCKQYQTDINNYADQIKAKDSAIQDIKKTVVTSDGVKELTILDYDANSKLMKISFRGQEFYIANTRINAIDYQDYVQRAKLYQNAGFMDGQCAILAQVYACDMMRGTLTGRSADAVKAQSPSTRLLDGCSSPNIDDVLEYVYNETINGRLTTLTVTQRATVWDGTKWTGPRHVVTVVGFDSSVKSYKDLNEDTILVLDCVDGKIQTLSQAREDGGHDRHIYAQDGNYFAHGATQDFLAKEVDNEEWYQKHGVNA